MDLSLLLPSLVCAECQHLLVPPTAICQSGHTFCESCHLALGKCSACDMTFLSNARNFVIEDICNVMGKKCPYFENGCNYALTDFLLAVHASTCIYKNVKCPVNKFPQHDCPWAGVIKDLVPHLGRCHTNLISNRNYILSSLPKTDKRIILHKSEVFTYYKYLKDGDWFAIVQRVGCTRQKFRSVFGIRSIQNNATSMNMIFPVRNIEEDIDEIMEEGGALMLDGAVVHNVVDSGVLSMVVTVEEVV
ncbi:hypothetical protein Cfor_05093 [Coptotermes formosanus]|uniref:SIAH-type domain-containing protein n=1 Tax=Coptotermes formosanus TaxID=36987 RepID=A0A6L2PZE9_COPFO|nr:hypothetical protein Cfor_05093 [Coptotermes formosanus]